MSSDYSSRAQAFRDALYDALASGSDEHTSEAGALAQLAALVQRCREAADIDETAAGALDAFEAIGRRPTVEDALSEANALFESPQRFRDALFFLRCLDRNVADALKLMAARAYLSAATAPAATYAGLATEQATLLDATTFESLWLQPARLDWMEDTIATWCRGYVPAYMTEHTDYNQHLAAVVSDVEAALWQTDVLHKLNRLERLGEPVAQPALTRFHAIEVLYVCPAASEELAAALIEAPVCPHCSFRLGDVAPVDALNSTLVAIERGLAAQQTRLAQRVVNRLLARPGRAQEDRLDRFIQVVQAADLAGLAQALDEGLLEFLDDLLQTPEPRINLIDRLAHDYPEVTDERLDEVVAAFRTLVQDELQRGGGRVVIGREDGA